MLRLFLLFLLPRAVTAAKDVSLTEMLVTLGHLTGTCPSPTLCTVVTGSALKGTLATAITLSAGIKGTLPTQLGGMTSLKHLSLSDGLTGLIPTELGFLTAINTLDLDNNDFSATIPSELGFLDQMVEL
jgi:hypothetical protein